MRTVSHDGYVQGTMSISLYLDGIESSKGKLDMGVMRGWATPPYHGVWTLVGKVELLEFLFVFFALSCCHVFSFFLKCRWCKSEMYFRKTDRFMYKLKSNLKYGFGY